LTVAAATLLAAGNAQAAQEIANLAANDNRLGIIATLFLPVVGWVGFNIFGPAKNQLDNMSRVVAVSAGLSAAALVAAPRSDAAQEALQLAASDNRLGIIATLFLPVVGWVLFNIFGPAKNQLDNMGRRGLVAGLGLSAAALLSSESAEAAEEVAQLAASDNRFLIIATLFVPAVAWVLFNILGPALNQLKNMDKPGR
jgi:photosystem II PsbY protein